MHPAPAGESGAPARPPLKTAAEQQQNGANNGDKPQCKAMEGENNFARHLAPARQVAGHDRAEMRGNKNGGEVAKVLPYTCVRDPFYSPPN
jgi:hypothetical protein